MKRKIVVTDDDPQLRQILRVILEKAGYEVELVPDGNEMFAQHFAVPDLFLLDKQLKGVDGFDICRFLKSAHRTRHIPVIMVSGFPGIQQQYKLAGADDYIEKPFVKQSLLQKIKKHLFPGRQ